MGTPPRSPDPCRTPGAKYGTDITTKSIALTIELPLDIFSGLGTLGERQLEADLHVALLRVMETVYRERWNRFRGRKIDGDVMPEHWHDPCDFHEPSRLSANSTPDGLWRCPPAGSCV